MRRDPAKLLIAGAAALLVQGCSTLATRQTAEPVPARRVQLSGGLDGLYYKDLEQKTKAPSGMVELGARVGLGRELDVGLRVYTFGAGLGTKWRVLRGPWMIALAPEVDYVRMRETQVTTKAEHVFVHLPVIIGHRFSDRVGISFGPKPLYGYYRPVAGGHAQGLMLGAFCNTDWRLSKRWKLLPEVSLYRTVWGEEPVNGWVGQLGAGVTWDL